MFKIVVFDSGYGGEMFADRLEEVLPIVKVVRVIDWRHAKELSHSIREARRVTEQALRPHIGKVNIIVFANQFLSLTSLRYFRRRFPDQTFLGLGLELPCRPSRDVLILTTKGVSHSLGYYTYRHKLRSSTKTLALDTWPAKIDDGELSSTEIAQTFKTAALTADHPRDIVLGCAQFRDIRTDLQNYFGRGIRIHDGFDDCIREICKTLKLRGGFGEKKK